MDPLSAFATAEPMLDAFLPNAFAFGLLAFILLIIFAIYVYSAFALMVIARKTATPQGWLAFIPIANTYLLWRISRTPAWTVMSAFTIYGVMVLGLIGFIALAALSGPSNVPFGEGFGSLALVFLGIMLFATLSLVLLAIQSYWWWRVAERRNYPGGIGLLMTLPTILQSVPYIGWMFGIVPLVTIGILAWRDQPSGTVPSER
jgi:hypothetical protein